MMEFDFPGSIILVGKYCNYLGYAVQLMWARDHPKYNNRIHIIQQKSSSDDISVIEHILSKSDTDFTWKPRLIVVLHAENLDTDQCKLLNSYMEESINDETTYIVCWQSPSYINTESGKLLRPFSRGKYFKQRCWCPLEYNITRPEFYYEYDNGCFHLNDLNLYDFSKLKKYRTTLLIAHFQWRRIAYIGRCTAKLNKLFPSQIIRWIFKYVNLNNETRLHDYCSAFCRNSRPALTL